MTKTKKPRPYDNSWLGICGVPKARYRIIDGTKWKTIHEGADTPNVAMRVMRQHGLQSVWVFSMDEHRMVTVKGGGYR